MKFLCFEELNEVCECVEKLMKFVWPFRRILLWREHPEDLM